MRNRNLHSTVKQAISFYVLLFFASQLEVAGQRSFELGLSGYPGFTAVNFEKALGYSDDHMEDWDQFCYSVSLKGFLKSEKPVNFGISVGWQRLYYAYYVIPYGPYPVYREFNISTISVDVLARYSPGQKFFITAGAGIHIFNDGIAPAVFIEPGYMIKLSEKIKIPLSVRLNPIFGDGTPITVAPGVGILFKIS